MSNAVVFIDSRIADSVPVTRFCSSPKVALITIPDELGLLGSFSVSTLQAVKNVTPVKSKMIFLFIVSFINLILIEIDSDVEMKTLGRRERSNLNVTGYRIRSKVRNFRIVTIILKEINQVTSRNTNFHLCNIFEHA